MIYASEVHCLRVKTTNTTNPHWKKHSAEKKNTHIYVYINTLKNNHMRVINQARHYLET